MTKEKIFEGIGYVIKRNALPSVVDTLVYYTLIVEKNFMIIVVVLENVV